MEGVYQTTEKVKLMARKKEPLEIVVNKSLRRVKKIWIKDFEGEIILETEISKVVLVYHRNGLKFFFRKNTFQVFKLFKNIGFAFPALQRSFRENAVYENSAFFYVFC